MLTGIVEAKPDQLQRNASIDSCGLSPGKLVVHYAGLESTFNFAARDGLYDLHYAAFFADCEPEILFVRAGCLLALFYDLTTQV